MPTILIFANLEASKTFPFNRPWVGKNKNRPKAVFVLMPVGSLLNCPNRPLA